MKNHVLYCQEHQSFFNAVRRMSGQPRSLQHLCRCALRRHLGSLCHFAVVQLNIPSTLKDYLLLHNDGQLR